jgi:hypothetical protein
MTFRISPKPPKGSGAYQQAVDLKRTLEDGGWARALTQRGPTPEHIPLMSTIWAVAHPRNGGVTKLSYGDHEIEFSCTRSQGMVIAIDGFSISWHIVALRIMLIDDDDDEEVAS